MLQSQHNILHIIDTLWLGGAQRVVKTIFERNASQHKLHLLVLRRTDQMIEVHHPNTTCISSCKKWNLKTAFDTIDHYIKTHQIRTLHCHLPKSQTLGLVLKILKHKNMNLIFQEQGDIMDKLPLNMTAYLFGRQYINKVVCCSETVRKRVLSVTFIPKEKVVVIYNFSSVTGAGKASNQTSDKHKHIGFAGRITKRKGWKEFIEAVSIIKPQLNEGTQLTIHIAGKGPEERELKKLLADRNLHNCSTLYGFVQNMRPFYQRLHVLCVPSRKEPMGMVHIEAMLCHVPVIASDVPGMNELLKHENNSLLFQPRNTFELANAMLRVLTDEVLTERLIKNGMSTASHFSYDKFEQETECIYKQLNA